MNTAEANLPSLANQISTIDPSLVQAELARRDPVEFHRQAWSLLEPATPYIHNWHIEFAYEYLQEVLAGRIRRLVLNWCPRASKSTCAEVMFPCWVWINRPEMRFVFTTCEETLARQHAVNRRIILQSEWYKRHFGIEIVEDQNLIFEHSNMMRGSMLQTTVGANVVGKGGHMIIVGDPINPDDNWYKPKRLNILRYVTQTLPSRLNDKRTGGIVIITHRLPPDDLTAVLEKMPHWTVVSIPAEETESRVYTFPRSRRTVVREQGDILWPEREDRSELELIRADLGDLAYEAQYNQRLASAVGGFFPQHCIRFWHHPGSSLTAVPVRMPDGSIFECACEPLPRSFDEVIQSWDLSGKGGTKNDFAVGGVWARKGVKKYRLDEVRRRMGLIQTIEAIKALSLRWPEAHTKLIEDRANGPSVQALDQGNIGGIVLIDPTHSKGHRAAATSPNFEKGEVYLPHPSLASWVKDYINELANFNPDVRGQANDRVDETCQAMQHFNRVPTRIWTLGDGQRKGKYIVGLDGRRLARTRLAAVGGLSVTPSQSAIAALEAGRRLRVSWEDYLREVRDAVKEWIIEQEAKGMKERAEWGSVEIKRLDAEMGKYDEAAVG